MLANILYAVPQTLREEYSDLMEELLIEVKKGYTESEKQSAGTYYTLHI